MAESKDLLNVLWKQFTLALNKSIQRPTVMLDNPYHLQAMLDTGATFPVWTADEDIIEKM